MILHKFHESKHLARAIVISSESYKYAAAQYNLNIVRRKRVCNLTWVYLPRTYLRTCNQFPFVLDRLKRRLIVHIH